MNDKLLVETAVLAGEIMLVSGAEIYRVEDTINHILRKANRQISEAIVLSTGIFVTLNDPELEPITVIRRVSDRSTNLNKVYLVNNVSRQLCSGTMTVEAAYEELQSVRTVQQYRPWLKNIGVVCVSLFFALLLGGGSVECLAAAFAGGVSAGVIWISGKIRLNVFCQTSLGAFAIAVAVLMMKQWLFLDLNRDIVIIGCIMPLVPGVIFTTAIRDTLNGDYAAGLARIMEAVVVALAVAEQAWESPYLTRCWEGLSYGSSDNWGIFSCFEFCTDPGSTGQTYPARRLRRGCLLGNLSDIIKIFRLCDCIGLCVNSGSCLYQPYFCQTL